MSSFKNFLKNKKTTNDRVLEAAKSSASIDRFNEERAKGNLPVTIREESVHIYGSQEEATMNPEERKEYFRLRKAVDRMTWEEVLWLHHNPTFHYSWDDEAPELPTNNRKVSVSIVSDEAEDAPILRDQRKLVLHHGRSIARLVKYGLAPMQADLQASDKGRIEFDLLTSPDSGVDYAQKMGLTKTEFLVMAHLKAMMNVRLVGSIRRFDEFMVAPDGIQQLKERVGEVAGLHQTLERATTREVVTLVGAMVVTTPKTLRITEVRAIFDFMGVDPFTARETMDSIVWEVSKRDTNKGFTLADVIPLANGSALKWERIGKELAKRNFIVAQRGISRIFYDAVITPTSWAFEVDGPTIRVEEVETLTINGKSSGDGAAATTVERFARVIGPAIGLSEENARKMARNSHYMHLNCLTALGFPKGHIHIIHDEADWEYPGADLVIDASSIDRNTRVHGDYARIAAISLTPGTVKEEVVQLWLNFRQLVPRLLEEMTEEQVAELPDMLFEFLMTVFHGAINGLWDPAEVEEEEEQDAWGEATMFNNFHLAEQAESVLRRQRRAHWYRRASKGGPFAAKTAGNKVFYSALQKVEKAISDYEEGDLTGAQQALCDIPVPARRLRTIVSAFAGKSAHVKPGDQIAFMFRPGSDNPHTVVVEDRLLLDPVFQFLMEILDHDDGVIAILFQDMSNGQKYVYLVKEPTSPEAGYFVPVSDELADQLGLPCLKLKQSPFTRRTRKSIEQWVKKPAIDVRKLERNPVDMRSRPHTALDYAWAVLEADLGKLGSLSHVAGITGLFGRSGVRPEVYFQASRVVDAMVNKDVTAKDLQEWFTVTMLKEVMAGTEFDTRYLHGQRSKYLNNYLVGQMEHRYPMEASKWVKDGVLCPNKMDGRRYDHLFEQVMRLHKPLMYNAALMQALSNGPIDNLIEQGLSDGAATYAYAAQLEAEDITKSGELTSSQKEEELYRLAVQNEAAVYKTAHYRPGDFAKGLLQLAVARGCNSPYGRRIHNDVPAALDLPLSEFLHEVELEGYFGQELAVPTIPVQVKNLEGLEPGERYVFVQQGEMVAFRKVEDDGNTTFVPARAATTEAQQWAAILSKELDNGKVVGTPVIFAGPVPASLIVKDGVPVQDPVVVFMVDEGDLPGLVYQSL